MKKRLLTIIAVILVLLIGFGSFRIHSQKSSIKKEMSQHLNIEGYDSREYKVQISYHIDNALLGYKPYVIKVTFTDDPESIYFYDYNSKKHAVVQTGISRKAPNTEDKDFKHGE